MFKKEYNSIIITLNDIENYGNRLQNYALNYLLSEYGSVTTAFCSDYKNWPASAIRIRGAVSSFIKRLISGLCEKTFPVLEKRHNRCVHFTKTYIPDSYVKIDSVYGVCPKFVHCKHYVIGSDQIWNFHWCSKKGLALRLGGFEHHGAKVFSYAASIGVSEIPEAESSLFQRYLPALSAISVREFRGAELVKEMTGLDAVIVLDPTLMLDVDKWLRITDNFVSTDDKYVLTYFLGRPSDEQEQDIQTYARAHGYRVRRILDLRDKETYVAGPQDFVELFSKAQYVFTDSYHACCFSILFHKQFTVFNRAGMTGKSSMNSRMETLFRLFDLNSVMMDSGLAPEIDYKKVDRLLEQHRKESRDWLDKAMEE